MSQVNDCLHFGYSNAINITRWLPLPVERTDPNPRTHEDIEIVKDLSNSLSFSLAIETDLAILWLLTCQSLQKNNIFHQRCFDW